MRSRVGICRQIFWPRPVAWSTLLLINTQNLVAVFHTQGAYAEYLKKFGALGPPLGTGIVHYPLETGPFTTCYHAKFGRSKSNCIRAQIRRKYGALASAFQDHQSIYDFLLVIDSNHAWGYLFIYLFNNPHKHSRMTANNVREQVDHKARSGARHLRPATNRELLLKLKQVIRHSNSVNSHTETLIFANRIRKNQSVLWSF